MRQTLFYIPNALPESWGGWPLLGVGILLAVWLVICGLFVFWQLRQKANPADLVVNLLLMAVVAGAIIMVPGMFGERGVPIRGFGVMVLLGVLSGHGVALWLARRANLHSDVIFSLAVWLLVGGFVGARLFFVLQYWRTFLRPSVDAPELVPTLLEMLKVTEGGIVLYGSIIGGFVALLLFCRRHQLRLRAVADVVAPAVMIGLAFGRLGCFFNGCCYGGVCELPWSVQFPPDSPPYVSQLDRGLLLGIKFDGPPDAPPVISAVLPQSPADAARLRPGDRIVRLFGLRVDRIDEARSLIVQRGGPNQPVEIRLESGSVTTIRLPAVSAPVHPTQLYSAINAVLLCGVLLAYWPLRRRDGAVFGVMLLLYPVARFVIEVIRSDEQSAWGTGLTISQNVSVLVFVAAAFYWAWLLAQPRGTDWPLPADHPWAANRPAT